MKSYPNDCFNPILMQIGDSRVRWITFILSSTSYFHQVSFADIKDLLCIHQQKIVLSIFLIANFP